MAGIYNGPSRGGTRGGKDQFSWDSVKSDQQREFYLGHSVKAATGRWQNGKDIFWYQKEKDPHSLSNDNAIAQEKAMAKQREEALMMEALGLKPKQPGTGTNAVEIFKKGEEEGGGGDARAAGKDDGDVAKKEKKRRRKEKKREKKQEKKERSSNRHTSKRSRRHRSRSHSSGRSSDDGENRRRRRKKSLKR